VRVLATSGDFNPDIEPEELFKRTENLGRRDFSALECFMILHPKSEVSGMSTQELEARIGYAENMNTWEKFI
jgi:hypothetical protein